MTDTTTAARVDYTTLSNLPVKAIRRLSDGSFAYLGDDGEIGFGGLCAETMLFSAGPGGDNEGLYANMSACPGGHETVEEFDLYLSLEPR